MSNIQFNRCISRPLFRCIKEYWRTAQHRSTTASAQQQCLHFEPKLATAEACPFTGTTSVAQETVPNHDPIGCSRTKSYDSIPSPKGLPLVGTVFDVMRNGGPGKIHQYCDKRHKELGPIYREKLGPTDAVFIADSHLIQTVYQNEGKYPVHLIPEPWIMYNELKGDERGLFFMDGPLWSQRRQSLNNIFLRQKTIAQYAKDFNDIATDVIESWKNCRNEDGVLENLEKELYKWSIESLGTMIFGRRMGCYINGPNSKCEKTSIQHFVQCVQQIFVESAKMTVIPPRLAYSLNLPVWRRFVESVGAALNIAKSYVEDTVADIVQKSKTGEPVDGILSKLLLKDTISEEEIVRIVTDLFLAAADTTSHTTQWALHLLAKNPQCQERILEEINTVIPEGEDITEENIQKLPYIKAVVKEALRLYPVAPFLTRILTKDLHLGDYHIPKGKLVLMSLYTTGRNPDYFPNPEQFKPERWLRTEGSREVLSTHACLPFGLGSRSCIGRRVAEIQMHLLLAKAVKNYDIRNANENDVDIHLRMITAPSEPIHLKITERENIDSNTVPAFNI